MYSGVSRNSSWWAFYLCESIGRLGFCEFTSWCSCWDVHRLSSFLVRMGYGCETWRAFSMYTNSTSFQVSAPKSKWFHWNTVASLKKLRIFQKLFFHQKLHHHSSTSVPIMHYSGGTWWDFSMYINSISFQVSAPKSKWLCWNTVASAKNENFSKIAFSTAAASSLKHINPHHALQQWNLSSFYYVC